jgi:hypothetical protein
MSTLHRSGASTTLAASVPALSPLADVILRRVKQGLVAEVRGNMAVLLQDVLSIGAGSPSSTLYSWPLATAAVA